MKKLIKKSFHRKEEGFTLIELLIVVVIIGILAGVLITVINPIRQQNRSRNATIKSSVSKVAFAVDAVKAGTGALPSNSQLTIELENITPNNAGCVSSTNTLDCLFSMPGTALPKYCSPNSAIPVATGTNPCFFRIISGGDASYDSLSAGRFRIGAAAFDLNTQVPDRYIIVFDSSQGLLMCGPTTPWATAPTTLLTVVQGPNPGASTCVILSE